MTKSPKFIDHRDMAVNALQKMSDLRITGMPVLDEDGCVVGSVLMQDIYKAGIDPDGIPPFCRDHAICLLLVPPLYPQSGG